MLMMAFRDEQTSMIRTIAARPWTVCTSAGIGVEAPDLGAMGSMPSDAHSFGPDGTATGSSGCTKKRGVPARALQPLRDTRCCARENLSPGSLQPS
jgi:hypothetical protein